MAACAASAGAQAYADPTLDAAFQTLTKLELGQDLQQFRAIDLAVVQSRADAALRANLESRWSACCKARRRIWRRTMLAASSPLSDPTRAFRHWPRCCPMRASSHMARYALEGLGSPAAAAALRRCSRRRKGGNKPAS